MLDITYLHYRRASDMICLSKINFNANSPENICVLIDEFLTLVLRVISTNTSLPRSDARPSCTFPILKKHAIYYAPQTFNQRLKTPPFFSLNTALHYQGLVMQESLNHD